MWKFYLQKPSITLGLEHTKFKKVYKFISDLVKTKKGGLEDGRVFTFIDYEQLNLKQLHIQEILLEDLIKLMKTCA